METLTLDFETYYDKEYSLRKMTPAEYILDPRFECTGLATKRGNSPSEWIHGQDVEDFFANEPTNVMAISHNSLFDMCICAWRYGWVPKLMVDTLGIARAVLQKDLRSLSLNKVADHLKLGQKTGALAKVLGWSREMIQSNKPLYDDFIEYGLQDADLCYGIFRKLVVEGWEGSRFPTQELFIMDMVLRCCVQPNFIANTGLLRQSIVQIQQEKEQTLTQAMLLGAEGKSALMSNDKFADLLRMHGVNPPTKISALTNKTTFAFAKSDQAFLDLLEHPNPAVQTIVSARLGHKSTIEETRHERFINIASLEWPVTTQGKGWDNGAGYRGLMPMPLKYSGAHTHRLSGDWKINCQNMGRGSALRQSLCAPEGYVVVAGDESQVEARFVCTLAGQEDMRQQFDNGEDVYSIFASDLFGRTITKADEVERFIGKQCLAADTLVLTNNGWKPIVNVKPTDKLWDGIEWVVHEGLLPQGVKETQTAFGLTMTGDHEILTAHGWQEWSAVHTQSSLFQSALSLASLPSKTGNAGEQEDGNQYVFAHAGKSQSQREGTSFMGAVQDAITVQKQPQQKRGTSNTSLHSLMMNTVSAFLTGYRLPYPAAITNVTGCSTTMAAEVLKCAWNGGKTGQSFSNMSRPCRGGMTLLLTWIERTTRKVTNRVTLDLLQSLKTWLTGASSEKCKNVSSTLKPVYDIANAGPRRRFTVMSSEGPVIVHNCILGLGYGLGKDKFSYSIPVLAWNQMGMKLEYTLEEGAQAVALYRTKNHKIKATWDILNTRGIQALAGNGDWDWGPVKFRKEEVILPNGLKLYYKNLRQEPGGMFGFEWVFDYGGFKKRIYGGKLLENITQALARIVVMDAALRVQKHLYKLGIRMALQAHDELVFVVKQEHEKITRYVLEHELKRRPEWLPNVPLDCELGSGLNYGDAK